MERMSNPITSVPTGIARFNCFCNFRRLRDSNGGLLRMRRSWTESASSRHSRLALVSTLIGSDHVSNETASTLVVNFSLTLLVREIYWHLVMRDSDPCLS